MLGDSKFFGRGKGVGWLKILDVSNN